MVIPGLLFSDSPLAPLLTTTPPNQARPSTDRHFSAFPLTSHLHTPQLRVVSLHPNLKATFHFARVPEIHDGFRWDVYLSRSSTVEDAANEIVDRFGLVRSLNVPGRGGGEIEYVLEENRDGGKMLYFTVFNTGS